MNSLLWSLLREIASALIAGEVRRAMQRMVAAAITWIIVGVLGIATLAFVYVLTYRLLAGSFGDERAAAIMVGGNLLLIGLILGVRAIVTNSRRRKHPQLKGDAAKALEMGEAGLEAGIALGAKLGDAVKKSAPQIVLIAAIAGVIIGLRPQLLGVFDRKKPPEKKRD
jgi:hypothetical protein